MCHKIVIICIAIILFFIQVKSISYTIKEKDIKKMSIRWKKLLEEGDSRLLTDAFADNGRFCIMAQCSKGKKDLKEEFTKWAGLCDVFATQWIDRAIGANYFGAKYTNYCRVGKKDYWVNGHLTFHFNDKGKIIEAISIPDSSEQFQKTVEAALQTKRHKRKNDL